MKNRSLLLLILLALLVGMAGCGGTPAQPSTAVEPTSASAPSPSTPVEPAPSQAGGVPTFEPGRCPFRLPAGQLDGQTVDCGYLVVPEDRGDPGGRTVRLAVAIFHPAGGVSEPDPILYLMGGPGASVLELLYLSFDMAFAPVLAAGRDLILYDQRGVGFSEPALDCPDAYDLGLELLDNERDGEQLSEEESDGLMGEAYRACAEDLSAVADLSAYNTVASAADVNDLRLALGYDQINLWATSYGTRLALGIMRDHPEGLRSVVLDSVYPPDANLYVEAPASLDRALDLLFDSCAADAACDAAFPDLRQVFFDAVEQLNAEPVETVVSDPLAGEDYAALLNGDVLFGVVFQLLYETEVLPELPRLIYQAGRGEYETITRIWGALLAQSTVSSRGMSFSVQCHEELSFTSREEYDAALAETPELAPYMEDTILGDFAFDLCTFWDSGLAGPAENEPVGSDLPTLIMQGQYDPITPPAWGRHVAETLPNSSFFEYPGVGHGASVVEGCPRDMLIAFLNDPTGAPDDSCIAQMEPLRFVVPAGGVGEIELEPFSSAELAIQGLAPVGWTEAGPGAYVRGSSGLDETALVMQSVPMTTGALFDLLSQQLGFDPGLESAAQEEVGRFSWQFYTALVQGLSMDLALAGEGSRSYFVLLIAEPDQRDALYEQVFRPALEALAPLE